MRWHLNSAKACAAGDLGAHLKERQEALLHSFEQHEQPLTSAQRAELLAESARMRPEIEHAITAACALAAAHGGSGFMVSASAHDNADGSRSFALFVDRLADAP